MKPNPNNPHTTLTTTPPTRQPVIIIEAARDDYAIRFSLRHRKSWRKLTPSQRGAILLAGATQLETRASQMRTEAADLADG